MEAQQIIDMFMPHTALTQIYLKNPPDPEHWGRAKACAIIYVDGQLRALHETHWTQHVRNVIKKYKRIRKEIEEL